MVKRMPVRVVLAPEDELRSKGILVVSSPGTCAIMAVITRVKRGQKIEESHKTHNCRLNDEEALLLSTQYAGYVHGCNERWAA